MEGLSVADADLVLYIHPSQSNNVSKAILRELSSLLFNFSDKFDGVVLAYAANSPQSHARILSGVHPYFTVKLQAKLLIFSPKPGMLLEGKVVKVTRESIHAVVLGFASAMITEEDIRDEFRYKTQNEEDMYISRHHKRHEIKAGTMICFVVKSFDEEVMHICGSLIPSHTGSSRWLIKHSEEAVPSRSKKGAESEQETDTQQVSNVGGPSSNNYHESKKSKKRKLADGN